MIKVSIIIPTYNVEKYIEKCIDSAINQTLKDIEIICVDDCSNDKTLSIIETYAKNDSRVKIISLMENGGVSKARNVGIDLAQGEYIGFIDSDDWVDLDFYEKLYNRAKEIGADVVKGEMVRVFPTEEKKSTLNDKIKENKYKFYGEFYTAIYNKEFLISNGIKFPENVLTSEDLVFSTGVILNYKECFFVSDTYYYYLQRPDSKVRTLNSDKIKSCIEGGEQILLNLNRSNIDSLNYKMLVENIVFRIMLKRCCRNNMKKEDISKIMANIYKNVAPLLKYDIDFDFNREYYNFYNKIYYKNIFERIFSIKKVKDKYCVTIMGIKIKLKRKN